MVLIYDVVILDVGPQYFSILVAMDHKFPSGRSVVALKLRKIFIYTMALCESTHVATFATVFQESDVEHINMTCLPTRHKILILQLHGKV